MFTLRRTATCLAVVTALAVVAAPAAFADEYAPVAAPPASAQIDPATGAPVNGAAGTVIDPVTGAPVNGAATPPATAPAPAVAPQPASSTVDENSTSYRIGQFAGMLILVVLGIAIVKRVRG